MQKGELIAGKVYALRNRGEDDETEPFVKVTYVGMAHRDKVRVTFQSGRLTASIVQLASDLKFNADDLKDNAEVLREIDPVAINHGITSINQSYESVIGESVEALNPSTVRELCGGCTLSRAACGGIDPLRTARSKLRRRGVRRHAVLIQGEKVGQTCGES